jgi:hypothetical protein
MVLELFSKATAASEMKHYIPTIIAHSSLKGMQYGIIGGFAAGLLISLYNKLSKKKKYISSKTIIKKMNSGMVIGVILVNGYYLMKIFRTSQEKNKELAFNLQKTSRQNAVDNIFLISMFLGEIILSFLKIEQYKNLQLVGGMIGGMLSLIFVDKYIDAKENFKLRK